MWNCYQYYDEIIFLAAGMKPVIVDFILWCGRLQIHILVVTQLCSWQHRTKSWLETLRVYWESGTSMRGEQHVIHRDCNFISKQGLCFSGEPVVSRSNNGKTWSSSRQWHWFLWQGLWFLPMEATYSTIKGGNMRPHLSQSFGAEEGMNKMEDT